MSPGKLLIVSGVILIIAGLLVSNGGLSFFGRLPGDIRIERDNFSFYFPLGTCLLISALASLLFWFLKR